jgi:hypothetical protein
MKTYVLVQMSSEGSSFTKVAETLESLGFQPITGEYDFVYEWDRKATVKDSLWFADRIQAALKGSNIYFRIETVED